MTVRSTVATVRRSAAHGAVRASRRVRSRRSAAALVGLVLAGSGAAACGAAAADPGARVVQWMSTSGFGSSVGTLLGDGGHVAEVVHRHLGAGALKAWCGVLESDAASAAGKLPSPDAALTTALDRAYRADQAAATGCYGASPSDTAALARSLADVNTADAYLEQALQRVTGLTGRVPSTTTTTVPGGGGGDPLGF